MATAKRPNTKIERFVIEKVKKLRKEKGLSQKDLAIRLNVSSGFIGDVENKKYRAKYNLTHINELAKIFECSPRDFFPNFAFKSNR
ncbi:MAG TPA: helix-turn-helix transcriptional regulator [Puia sp.]|jgi:transcriptional regulator with XRE-family HTH domain